MKGATLFSGFGGVDIGMEAAGIGHAWGIEYDDAIAAVARQNGLNTITVDILDCDPNDCEWVDLLHMSPPCPNFSNAKANREEGANDLALAQKCCEFIEVMKPSFVTLENVYGYRDSKSWQTIARCFLDNGYTFDYWHVNAADYGVPQTRMRMIVIARLDGKKPAMPDTTHSRDGSVDLFEGTKKWVGWYEAIEDLILTLPDSHFAPWQLKRLPKEFSDHFAVHTQANSGTAGRNGSDRITTIAAQKQPDKAFVLDGGWMCEASNVGDDPFFVADTRPAGKLKAFITDRPNSSSKRPNRMGNEPAQTVVCYSPKHQAPNGFANGRVVKLTIRALARLQSFPDWYQFPGNASLACKGIGNAVPPLLYQRIAESLK